MKGAGKLVEFYTIARKYCHSFIPQSLLPYLAELGPEQKHLADMVNMNRTHDGESLYGDVVARLHEDGYVAYALTSALAEWSEALDILRGWADQWREAVDASAAVETWLVVRGSTIICERPTHRGAAIIAGRRGGDVLSSKDYHADLAKNIASKLCDFARMEEILREILAENAKSLGVPVFSESLAGSSGHISIWFPAGLRNAD